MSIAFMKIKYKIALIVCALLVPLALFAGLFIQQIFKDIEFAQKEQRGTEYLKGA